MPRFFFNISDGRWIPDDEGQDFETVDEAREEAVLSARSLMREAIMKGHLPLQEEIQISNESGAVVAVIAFRDAVTIDNEHADQPRAPD